MRNLLLALAMLAVCAGCQPAAVELSEQRETVQLGRHSVNIVTFSHPDDGVAYINLHEDESTSVEATRSVLRRHGGRITMIEHTGDRRVAFAVNSDTFSVDPNRIFTDAGIQMTLRTDGGSYIEEAHREVATFAQTLLDIYDFDNQPVVVAMHNNSETFSIESYIGGGRYESSAEEVYINPEHDISDFYYVTDRGFFDYLSNRGYNVVLQDDDEVTDDGSLSVFSGYHAKPYINIEAGHGHFDTQVEMIEIVLGMFEEMGYYE